MNGHCATWQNTTFPASVTLADDIIHYNTKAQVYFSALNQYIQALVANPNDSTAQQALKGILDTLTKAADSNHQSAKHVADQMTQFSTDSTSDHVTLVGSDGQSGLFKTYNDSFGAQSTQVQNLQKDLAKATKALKADNDAYNHDMVVATTSAT